MKRRDFLAGVAAMFGLAYVPVAKAAAAPIEIVPDTIVDIEMVEMHYMTSTSGGWQSYKVEKSKLSKLPVASDWSIFLYGDA